MRIIIISILLSHALVSNSQSISVMHTFSEACTGDVICENLVASKAAYLDADVDDWVMITASEFTDITTDMQNMFTAGLPDGAGNTRSTSETKALVFNGSLGANRYLCMFRYYGRTAAGTASGMKVKQSTAQTSGYSQAGNNTLPAHSKSGNGYRYFVIKKSTLTYTSGRWIALYTANASYKDLLAKNDRRCSGDCNNPGTLGNTAIAFQWYSTDIKQW